MLRDVAVAVRATAQTEHIEVMVDVDVGVFAADVVVEVHRPAKAQGVVVIEEV